MHVGFFTLFAITPTHWKHGCKSKRRKKESPTENCWAFFFRKLLLFYAALRRRAAAKQLNAKSAEGSSLF